MDLQAPVGCCVGGAIKSLNAVRALWPNGFRARRIACKRQDYAICGVENVGVLCWVCCFVGGPNARTKQNSWARLGEGGGALKVLHDSAAVLLYFAVTEVLVFLFVFNMSSVLGYSSVLYDHLTQCFV